MIPNYIEVLESNPLKITFVNRRSLIEVGRPGTFDDSGITLGSVVKVDSEIYWYYTGWKRRRVVSFELSIGLLKWDESSKRFSRVFEGPIIGQDMHHPYLAAGPYVRMTNGSFRMWYCSGSDWKFVEGRPEPIYNVHSCTSKNGIDWNEFEGPLLDTSFTGEVISAPWVLSGSTGSHMWYSYRGIDSREAKNYMIGYAVQKEGGYWERLDSAAGIRKSKSGWDSEMMCYPCVIEQESNYLMFYSGNQVGKGGIGVASMKRANLR